MNILQENQNKIKINNYPTDQTVQRRGIRKAKRVGIT